MSDDFEYDVALSFAGEQRQYVDAVASDLRAAGVRVFYDSYEKVNLWGKDLYEHLDYVYQRAARYCVVFASSEYADKMWTTHERKGAQARAIREKEEYILPARFDDTEIPGIRGTVGYIGLKDLEPAELASLILEKLGPRRPTKYLPDRPIRLFQIMGVTDTPAEGWVQDMAEEFFLDLIRMTEAERHLLFEVFASGCSSKMPENMHIDLDLLRRITGVPPAEARNILAGLSSLGINASAYTSSDHEDVEDMVRVSWEHRRMYDDDDRFGFSIERSTDVACHMLLGTTTDMCRECSLEALTALDFSALAVPIDENDAEVPSLN